MSADVTSCGGDSTGLLQLGLQIGACAGRKEGKLVEADSSLRAYTGILGSPGRYDEESEGEAATGEG
jgi:hypothetical protein